MESYNNNSDDANGERPRSRSEELFLLARSYQEQVINKYGDATELSYDSKAKRLCLQLNEFARQVGLIGEKASISASDALLSSIIRDNQGGHSVQAYRVSSKFNDIEALETLEGRFVGYGYYVAENAKKAVLGARIVMGYETTLALSEGPIVAFCPVESSSLEFEFEQKEQLIMDIRKRLYTVADRLSLDVQQQVNAIDRLCDDAVIEDIAVLRRVSRQMQVLLARTDISQNDQIINHLIELIAAQLELPMRLDVQTSAYQGETNLPKFVKYSSKPGDTIYNFDAHLIISKKQYHSELFLAGIREEQNIQIALSDILHIDVSEL